MSQILRRLAHKVVTIPYLVPYWTDEERSLVLNALFNSEVIEGPSISLLEKEISKRFDVKYSVATNLGRNALEIGLRAVRVGEKNEVIVPSFCCSAVLYAILNAGCKPKFVDIRKDFNADPQSISRAITEETGAVVLPHLNGKIADIDAIQKITTNAGVLLIDDAAQCLGGEHEGKYIGTFGDFGVLSFGVGKVINAAGGGALITNSKKLYADSMALAGGAEDRKTSVSSALETLLLGAYRKYTLLPLSIKNEIKRKVVGVKIRKAARIPELQANLALHQLEKLSYILKKFRQNSSVLSEQLSDSPGITTPEKRENYFVKYPVQIDAKKNNAREDFYHYMASQGIETEYSYTPLHIRSGFSKYGKVGLPVTEDLWDRTLNLPNHPALSEEDMKVVASFAKRYLMNKTNRHG